VVIGWLVFRRITPPESAPAGTRPEIDARALRIGLPAVAVLLVGFTFGDAAGIEPWMVAAAVTAGLALVAGELPLTSVPLGAIVVAAGLAVLAAAASPHLGLDRVLGSSGAAADVRALLGGVIGADAINNLPALLVGLPHLEGGNRLWAYLAGVNFGPVLWAGGSLAGLLWLDPMRRFGIAVGPGTYARIGVRVGIPALAGAGVVVLVTGWVVG
jgi:arsenical pump membrane protein